MSRRQHRRKAFPWPSPCAIPFHPFPCACNLLQLARHSKLRLSDLGFRAPRYSSVPLLHGLGTRPHGHPPHPPWPPKQTHKKKPRKQTENKHIYQNPSPCMVLPVFGKAHGSLVPRDIYMLAPSKLDRSRAMPAYYSLTRVKPVLCTPNLQSKRDR